MFQSTIPNYVTDSAFLKEILAKTSAAPDDVVFVDKRGSRKTSHRDFETLARKVCRYLEQLNIARASFIVVDIELYMEQWAALLGIWLHGSVAVPVNSRSFTQERVDYISKHCESSLTITLESFEEIQKCEPTREVNLPSMDDTAVLLYTSGSTGTPKGILHDHKSLSTYTRQPVNQYFAKETKRAACIFPSSSVAALASVLIKISKDFAIHLLDLDLLKNIDSLQEYLVKHSINSLFVPPSLNKMLHGTPSLKHVLTAGDQINGDCSRDGFQLHNLYGCTETFGVITQFTVDKLFDQIPVGKPDILGEYALLDEDGNPVEKGDVGELCLKGNYTTGYFKEPELTAKLFEGGWLHTGDNFKELHDGNLIYTGRKDRTCKINAQRVNLNEVETLIKHINGVGKVAVRSFLNEAGSSSYLCTYYSTEGSFSPEALRQKMMESMPLFMVPKYIIKIEKWPLTPTGKIAYHQLPIPNHGCEVDGTTVANEDLNTSLLQIVRQVMEEDDIEETDNLIQKGLSSLDAITICNDVADKMKLQLPPQKIQEHPIVAELVKFLKPRTTATLVNEQTIIATEQVADTIRIMEQHPAETVLNISSILKLRANISPEAVKKAMAQVINAHPILKTTFEKSKDDGKFIMIRHDKAPVVFEDVYLDDDLDEKDGGNYFHSLTQSFKGCGDKQYHLKFIHGNRNNYVFADMSHVVTDGLSSQIIMQELGKVLAGENISTDYAAFEYALEEARQIATNSADEDAYFKKLLEGKRNIRIPESADPDCKNCKGKFASVDLPVTNFEKIQNFCNANDITAAYFFLTATLSTMREQYNNENAMLCMLTSGREHLNSSNAVGMFLKDVPIAMGPNDIKSSWTDTIKSIRSQALKTTSQGCYSVKRLQREYGFSNDIAFLYQGNLFDKCAATANPLFEDVTLLSSDLMDCDVEIQPVIINGSCTLNILYDGSKYNKKEMQDLAQKILHKAEEML